MGRKGRGAFCWSPLVMCAVLMIQTASALSLPGLDGTALSAGGDASMPATATSETIQVTQPTTVAATGPGATQDPAAKQTASEAALDVLQRLVTPQGEGPRWWMEPGTKWTRITGHGMDSNHGEMEFACPPPGDETTTFGDLQGKPTVVRARCPFRIIDGGDLMGSPSIAVNPYARNEVAIFSLHGGATDQGATSRSRDPDPDHGLGGLSFTTFTSMSTGVDWEDQPYGHGDWGEHSQGVMDDHGNIYLVALSSETVGVGPGGEAIFDNYFELYKANRADQSIHYFGHEVYNRAVGNEIDEVNLVVVRDKTLPTNQTEYEEYMNRTREGNETQGPADDSQVGQAATDEIDTDGHRIMAVWHEKAADWRNSTTGKSSWIDAMWTDTTSDNDWERLQDDQLIGPCRDASNPVSYNGIVYVACVVDAGYRGVRGARIGDVHIWSIDPETGRKHFVSDAPVGDGRPKLAMNGDGLMAITSSKLLGEGPEYERNRIDLAWAWYGEQWLGGAGDIGIALHDMVGGSIIREARITGMTILDDTPNLVLSYMERAWNTAGDPEYDPNDPLPSQNTFIEYHKVLASYEHCLVAPVSAYNLELGQIRHPFEEGVVNEYTGAFNDLQDGLVTVRDQQAGGELVYFAYGDHGVIQYGLIVGASTFAGECPPLFQPPLFIASGIIPTSAGTGAAVSTGLAASLFAPAAAGLGYLLVAKRRRALTVAVKS